MATGNPIPFNPAEMPLKQAMECAEALRMIFAAIERGNATDEGIAGRLREIREQMLQKYGEAR